MPPEIAKILWDMDDAAAKIQRYAAGRSFADYVQDDYFRSAVERQFATVGEAMTRLHKLAPDLAGQIANHRKIRSFRNVIIHSYDAIDDATTWDVVENHLTTLRSDLAKLMAPTA